MEDFLVDDETWAIRHLIVDTRNWWPGKKVILSPGDIRQIDWSGFRVNVDRTRDEIKTGPEFDPARPVSADYTDRLEAHYSRIREKRGKDRDQNERGSGHR